MNILEQEDIIKGLPDQALMKEASAPSGEVPQFLVISEIKRRGDMRKRYESQQQQNQGTVKDQILAEAMGGIAGMTPPQMAPQQLSMAPMGAPPMGGMPPQGMPPMAPPQAPKPPMPQGGMPPMGGISSMPQGMPPMGMAQGGIVQMVGGGQFPNQLQRTMPSGQPLQQIMNDLLSRVRSGELAYADVLKEISGMSGDSRDAALSYARAVVEGEGAGMRRLGQGVTLSDMKPKTETRPASEIYSQSAVTGLVEDMSRAAQENMPSYSMIAPAGMGEMPSMDVNFGMPTREQAQAADRAKVESLRAGLSPSITSGDIDSAIAGMVTERAPRSTAPELSTAPQRGAGGRPFDLGGISDLYADSSLSRGAEAFTGSAGDLAQQSLDEAAGRRQGIFDFFTGQLQYKPESIALLEAEQAGDITRAERKLALSGRDDASVQIENLLEGTNNLGVGPTGPVSSPFGKQKEGLEPSPVGEAVTELSSFPSGDQSNPFLSEAQSTLDAAKRITGDISVQGRSPVQTQPSPASKAPSDPDMPALDFSDLIAEGKQQALANAMIQLGAGVASGDVSKGLAAAGTAAMEGTADARALDMKRRLAEYQAGREDIRRGDEADRFERRMNVNERQFRETLEQAGEKLTADLEKADRVSKGQLLSFVADIVKESMRNYTPKAGESADAVAAALSDELLRKYAPYMDVDVSGLPVTGGVNTASRSRADILSQYNVAN